MNKTPEIKQQNENNRHAYEALVAKLKGFRLQSDDVEKNFIRELMSAEQSIVWQYGGHGSFARFLDDTDICDPKRYEQGKLALTEMPTFTNKVGILVAREVVRIPDASKRELAMHDLEARTDHSGRPPSARTAQGIVNGYLGRKSSKTAPEWERENDELRQRIRFLESENQPLANENTKLRAQLGSVGPEGVTRQPTNKPKSARR